MVYSLAIMKLAVYLQENDLKPDDFAAKIGVCRTTVYNWVSGRKRPRKEQMLIIIKATDRKVTPDDFYDVE